MSFSADCIFLNPVIYNYENSILKVYYDFFIDEPDKIFAMHTYVTIVINMMLYFDKTVSENSFIPIGLFEDDNDEPFLSMPDLFASNIDRTNRVKALFLEKLGDGKTISMKILVILKSKKETDFKVIDVELNLLIIEPTSIKSLKKKLTSNDFLKIFFKEQDAAYYNTFIPFNKVQITNKLRQEREFNVSQG